MLTTEEKEEILAINHRNLEVPNRFETSNITADLGEDAHAVYLFTSMDGDSYIESPQELRNFANWLNATADKLERRRGK